MPELKKIRVREAKARDIGLFKKLFAGFLEKAAKEGSPVLASEKSLSMYESLFDVYLSPDSEYEGVILFVADVGVLMCGDAGIPLDHSGKPLTLWGIHVTADPPEAVREALQQRAMEWAKEHEFTGVFMDSYRDSEPIEGFESVISVLYREIG